jgi:hypothetical protein
VLWAALAFWRMMTMNPYNFLLLFILGVFELVVVGRILIQPNAGLRTDPGSVYGSLTVRDRCRATTGAVGGADGRRIVM